MKNLPGDKTKEEIIESMIRVDHAGEYGATRIYAGQLAVLKCKESEKVIRHMADQEEVHLKEFSEMVGKRKVRPTVLLPLWHVAGYALGATTALLGEKAAMACTVAVEEVIDEHYSNQLELLGEDEADLKKTISKFRAEELEHRDMALQNKAQEAPAYHVLSAAVKGASRLAIWLSERI